MYSGDERIIGDVNPRIGRVEAKEIPRKQNSVWVERARADSLLAATKNRGSFGDRFHASRDLLSVRCGEAWRGEARRDEARRDEAAACAPLLHG